MPTAARAIAATGWRIVVSAGDIVVAKAVSSKPQTLIMLKCVEGEPLIRPTRSAEGSLPCAKRSLLKNAPRAVLLKRRARRSNLHIDPDGEAESFTIRRPGSADLLARVGDDANGNLHEPLPWNPRPLIPLRAAA